jgi:hypothetical protein
MADNSKPETLEHVRRDCAVVGCTAHHWSSRKLNSRQWRHLEHVRVDLNLKPDIVRSDAYVCVSHVRTRSQTPNRRHSAPLPQSPGVPRVTYHPPPRNSHPPPSRCITPPPLPRRCDASVTAPRCSRFRIFLFSPCSVFHGNRCNRRALLRRVDCTYSREKRSSQSKVILKKRSPPSPPPVRPRSTSWQQ